MRPFWKCVIAIVVACLLVYAMSVFFGMVLEAEKAREREQLKQQQDYGKTIKYQYTKTIHI